MRATFAGLVWLGFKRMTEKSGVHFGDCKLGDLLEVLDITELFVVKRKTVEAIPFWVNVHRAVIRTAKINIPVLP